VTTALEWGREHRAGLFDEIPSGVFVIDRAGTIVDHNRAFASLFGEARGRSCYRVLKEREEPCPLCAAQKSFADGGQRVLEERGVGRDGRPVDYLVQLSPIRRDGGEVEFVAAITTDLTATKRLQREYQILFEKVPCYVAVINRDLRVVRANERFRETFGEARGEHCYDLFKKRHEPCPECPVERTFLDGESHTVPHVGIGRDGQTTHYLAFTAPLERDEGDLTHVIQMSLDVTDLRKLELRLSETAAMRRALVQNSLDATLILDDRERIQLVNRAAEDLWGYPAASLLGQRPPSGMIPAPLHRVLAGKTERELVHEARVITSDGEKVPVRMAAMTLDRRGEHMGSAVIVHDLREVRKLQREKLEAERLAAVGQTVAGLAHGIKNILTGLEGGMYVMSSGLKKDDDRRTRQGWEMLERNMGRISALAKNLLAFSRGDRIEPRQVRVHEVVEDVVGLFRESAHQHGVDLRAELDRELEPAWIDPEGLHSCLANLVSNALDACMVSQNPACSVTVRLLEREEVLVLEVTDTGCGMDYELKQKAFTSFFTTKGKGGTGLGLLITRKIVQQHGGTVTVLSTPGEGATFRLALPRDRLPRPPEKEDQDD
jgi:PAS domain S-box-containing protein